VRKRITLKSGIEVTVYPVPPIGMTDITRANRDHGDVNNLRSDAALLTALPEVEVPDDWRFPDGLRYGGLEPTPGEFGRRLDYIKYGLLLDASDINAVLAVMYGDSVSEEEIASAEAAFRTNS